MLGAICSAQQEGKMPAPGPLSLHNLWPSQCGKQGEAGERGGGRAEARRPGLTGLGVSLTTGAVPCRFLLSAPHGSHDAYPFYR